MTEVNYHNTKLDVLAFVLFCLFRRWPMAAVWIIALAVAAPSSWRIAYRPDEPIVVVFIAFLVQEALVFAAVFVVGVLSAAFVTLLSRNSERHAQRTLTLTQAGIDTRSEHTSATQEWTAIRSIRSGGSYLYMFTGSLEAYIVPRRAFEGKDQWRAFRASANELWAQARP